MADMVFDDKGFLEEPCLSCDKAYIEDLWGEYWWYCDEKECPYKVKSEDKYMQEIQEIEVKR